MLTQNVTHHQLDTDIFELDDIKDPQTKVKGNRMPFSGFVNATDIADVAAYLQTLK